jgi:hypothetical protein
VAPLHAVPPPLYVIPTKHGELGFAPVVRRPVTSFSQHYHVDLPGTTHLGGRSSSGGFGPPTVSDQVETSSRRGRSPHSAPPPSPPSSVVAEANRPVDAGSHADCRHACATGVQVNVDPLFGSHEAWSAPSNSAARPYRVPQEHLLRAPPGAYQHLGERSKRDTELARACRVSPLMWNRHPRRSLSTK